MYGLRSGYINRYNQWMFVLNIILDSQIGILPLFLNIQTSTASLKTLVAAKTDIVPNWLSDAAK